MAKRKRQSTLSSIEKRIKEGRGQGYGSDYIPWLLVQDVPSIGRATRIHGWKTKRIHHLLSDLERSYFYLLEWSDLVTDIREQYSLLPLEETMAIADEVGIKHPTDPKTKEPIVITTDFLINMGETLFARTIKMADDLESKRVIEKFEIERLYWNKRNIDWGIVTEAQIPKNIVKNIEYVHKEYVNEDVEQLGEYIVNNIEQFVFKTLNSDTSTSLSEATSYADESLGLDPGTSLAMARHFIAIKRWKIDMDTLIIPSKNLQVISIDSDNINNISSGGLA